MRKIYLTFFILIVLFLSFLIIKDPVEKVDLKFIRIDSCLNNECWILFQNKDEYLSLKVPQSEMEKVKQAKSINRNKDCIVSILLIDGDELDLNCIKYFKKTKKINNLKN